MKVKQRIVQIITQEPVKGYGNSLRGYIANRYPDIELVHNHRKDGSLIYIFPRIQYKVISGTPFLIGIEEGVDIVRAIEEELNEVEIGSEVYPIIKKVSIEEEVCFGISEHQVRYNVISPWLALNEENYKRYNLLNSQIKKIGLLKKVLTGNLLYLSKGIGYVVLEQIKVSELKIKERETYLKGTPMLGFLGTFSVNFEIPDYWGIGKSVSRGFGTIIRT